MVVRAAGLLIALFGCGLALLNFSIDEIINPRLRSAPAAVKSVRVARKNRREGTTPGSTSSTQAPVDASARDDEKVNA